MERKEHIMTHITNVTVLGDDFQLHQGSSVTFENGTITAVGAPAPAGAEVVDGAGDTLIPGFVDVHTHGCAGHDTCDADDEGLRAMARQYASKGVTSTLATSMTIAPERLKNVFETVRRVMDEGTGAATIRGTYMEGPFFNAAKKGCQAGEYLLNPDFALFSSLNAASGGAVRIVAVASELPGAMEFIEKASKVAKVTLAHTTANYECAGRGIEAGAGHITHTFNAMPPFLHRDPGVVGAALDHENVRMELICDGIHLHPAVIRMMFHAAGAGRLVLVSDSMSAAGVADGEYELGGQKVTVSNGRATLDDGTIAGSASNLLDCVKNCVRFGVAFEDAVRAATINPADEIGLADHIGSIAVGKEADLVLLNGAFDIERVYIAGKLFQ